VTVKVDELVEGRLYVLADGECLTYGGREPGRTRYPLRFIAGRGTPPSGATVEEIFSYAADAMVAPLDVVAERMRAAEQLARDLEGALGEGAHVEPTLDRDQVAPGSIRIELPVEAARRLTLRLAWGA
jgi:hypothetical protein